MALTLRELLQMREALHASGLAHVFEHVLDDLQLAYLRSEDEAKDDRSSDRPSSSADRPPSSSRALSDDPRNVRRRAKYHGKVEEDDSKPIADDRSSPSCAVKRNTETARASWDVDVATPLDDACRALALEIAAQKCIELHVDFVWKKFAGFVPKGRKSWRWRFADETKRNARWVAWVRDEIAHMVERGEASPAPPSARETVGAASPSVVRAARRERDPADLPAARENAKAMLEQWLGTATGPPVRAPGVA